MVKTPSTATRLTPEDMRNLVERVETHWQNARQAGDSAAKALDLARGITARQIVVQQTKKAILEFDQWRAAAESLIEALESRRS
jgi:hypothetical protein